MTGKMLAGLFWLSMTSAHAGLLDGKVTRIVEAAIEQWAPLLACSETDLSGHAQAIGAWQQERSELVWLFDDARLSAVTIRQIMALTEPSAMIAAIGPDAERHARCTADASWRDLAIGTHQSDPSLEITRLLEQP
jgi:hypothetical protein